MSVSSNSSRLNTNLLGGAVIMAVSAIALFSTRNLEMGTLDNIGPALFPRALAALLLVLGFAIFITGLRSSIPQETMQAWKPRSLLFVLGGVLIFGLAIRPLGIVLAAPLALLVAGFATSETIWRQLLPFVILLTIFCTVLFRYLLSLPIPLAPWWIGY